MGQDLLLSPEDTLFHRLPSYEEMIRVETPTKLRQPFYKHISYSSLGCFVVVFLCLIALLAKVTLMKCGSDDIPSRSTADCQAEDNCSMSLVESIPLGLNLTALHPSTYDTWMDLIEQARHSIDIASFYWTLRSSDVYPDPSSQQGEAVFQALLRAGLERGVHVRIAQSLAAKSQPNIDTEYLMARGAADVRDVDFNRLMGGGVLHTKMWIIDGRHVYVGSANMDWRSLTQVKELGAVMYNCSCLASDMSKLFAVYWYLGVPTAKLPQRWPAELETRYNLDEPMIATINASEAKVYVASSPPPFCPAGRTTDIDAIVNVIGTAKKFVYIAVMDYFPLTIYTKSPVFWPVIDNALRSAAIDRRVNVRLLASHWNHTRPSLAYFLRSLADLTASYPHVVVETKLFRVPSTPEQAQIPFGRVNHNKYMVTDNTAYVGTSNWSGDYFVNTAGVGLVVHEETVRRQLEEVFRRDWDSPYATPA